MDIRKKNWLFVLPTDSVQGSEQIVMNFAKYLVREGEIAKVIILTKKRKKGWIHLENEMQITYFPFSAYTLGIIWFIPYLIFSKTKNIDYTFTSQTLINGIIGFSKRVGLLKGSKIILRESNSIFELLKGNKLFIYSLFYKLGYVKSNLVICQTEYMKSQLISALPNLTKKLKLIVIPNPVDFSDIKLKSQESIEGLKTKRYLVAAGRLVPAKGFDILIDAFEIISNQFSDLELIILGAGKDLEFLKQKRNLLGLEKKISFPGYVSNVYPYFKEAEACVLSSRIEGFPNVLLQMMSQNTKAVATLSAGDIDKIPGIFTCNPDNISGLSMAIKNCLLHNTNENRGIFDKYLDGRTQEAFYTNIMHQIEP
tara:strand:- start:1909 stop:3012 length:1104 start_codon:yes stop_codon:yes gene_type:complete